MSGSVHACFVALLDAEGARDQKLLGGIRLGLDFAAASSVLIGFRVDSIDGARYRRSWFSRVA